MKLLICGKGGAGKSTVAALIAMAMEKQGKHVLLVDADESNIGLYRMLGLPTPAPLMENLGGKKGFQEKTRGTGLGGPPPLFHPGMTLDALPDGVVAKKGRLRVISTGKILHFGEGCACPMGRLFTMLFAALDLADQDLVIVDTAAGLEHFGRRLDSQVDRVVCVVAPSYESVIMARRARTLAAEAGLPLCVILNRTTPQVAQEMAEALEDLDILGHIPENSSLFLNTLRGEALDSGIPEMDRICQALDRC